MLLKKFEVFGFKSFADKTELEFSPGINAIVGPNGSGKSNLSDAIRWALGEQSIRNLRGAKMEDVIFSGTTHRRPLGIAEVSLTFDNYDALLPLDYGEVTVTRRVFRSGESEYFINKTHCRLKDLQELLAGTGLGRESMAVIGQNKIDEILNTKPEERRLLFEEVIGIARYKQRRKDAVRKMEDTEQNLTRVRDIIAEIETQLEPLRESAEKTSRYNKLHTQYVQCKTTLFINRYDVAQVQLTRLAAEEKKALDASIAASTQTSVAESERELLGAELSNADEQLLYYDRVLAAGSLAMQKADGRIQLSKERLEHIHQRQGQLAAEDNQLSQRREFLTGNLEECGNKLAALCVEEDAAAAELNEATALLEEQNESIKMLQQHIHEARDLVFDQLQEVVDERNNLRQAEREIEMLAQKKTRLTREQDVLSGEYQAAVELRQAKEAEYQSCLQQGKNLASSQITLTKERETVEAVLRQHQAKEKEATNRRQECLSKRKVLASMQSAYEGFSFGSRNVLKSTLPWRTGILGAVAQLLSVPDAYVTAIETSLGAAMQNIVTENEQTAKAAVNFLKEGRLGRATFLPIESIRAQGPRDFELAAAYAPGAVGMAASLVETEPRFNVLKEMLLGRTIVATDLDAALRLSRSNGQRLRIVTLEGELINPGGSITGGRSSQKEQGFMSRQNEIDELTRDITQAEKQLEKIADDIQQTSEKIAENEQTMKDARQAQAQAELQKSDIERGLIRWCQDEERLRLAVDTCRQELEQGDTLAVQQKHVAEITQTRLESLREREAENKNKIDDWQEELVQTQSKRDIQDKAVTELRIRQNDFLHRRENAVADQNRQTEEKDRIDKQWQTLRKEAAGVAGQQAETERDMKDASFEREDLVGKNERYRIFRNDLFTEKSRLLVEVQKLDRALRDLKRRCHDLEETLHTVQLEYTKNDFEMKTCREQIEGQYNVSLEEAAKTRIDAPVDEIEKQARHCEVEIQAIGPVNPTAVEEYRRTADRYEFMQSQSVDLETAVASLRQIIADIDHTMAERFTAGFTKINAHFADIFVRLFGGGTATLELTTPDNVLESGVEIFVQPPGKRRQNLALLSGGERALTVISILFSFLAYRPAPFCVIDEVDSALDETNVRRFSEFLTEYSKHSQFIVVTHRKGTMEAADILHGVTMEDSGVSRLVSVKFLEDGKPTEEGRMMRGTV
ncbi:MAG TPA: chromosome segregation protein SMC [Negativicutes bacterium]|nr:chromosome segregation protein SMC [Negativicutes bacterium]